MTTTEQQIELDLIAKLGDLKYTYRPDIRDRAALEANFRAKFEALNRVHLTDSEFQRLLDGIITPDVYGAAQRLRNINSFERDDGTPLNYTLVNIRDWCKNDFEVVNQLRMNTDNSHHRYDVMLLINGVPAVQIELKTLAVSPRRVMQQIVDYKTDWLERSQLQEKAAHYRLQIASYALAAEAIWGRPIRDARLYFARLAETLPLDVAPAALELARRELQSMAEFIRSHGQEADYRCNLSHCEVCPFGKICLRE